MTEQLEKQLEDLSELTKIMPMLICAAHEAYKQLGIPPGFTLTTLFWFILQPTRNRMIWGASGLSFWLADGVYSPAWFIVRRKDGFTCLVIRGGMFSLLYTLKEGKRRD